MTDRPILRFPDPTASERRPGPPRNPPIPSGPGRGRQGQRFQSAFDRLSTALDTDTPEVVLREDPAGIAPERAMVFITAGTVQDFARVARDIGLEVFAEDELDALEDFPEGFAPARDQSTISRTLYATMPTLEVFKKLLVLWRAYQNEEHAPRGAAPWWKVFDRLLELRPWGPEDRLTESARATIEDRLPFDDNAEVTIEIEIWPTSNNDRRTIWRERTEQRIVDLGGQIIDRSSIDESGFIYEALLTSLPTQAVREMLNNPANITGLAVLEGVQLILPQTVGQAAPGDADGHTDTHELLGDFDVDAPIRCALLDGTPVAGHAALDGGIVVEDIHDLVGLSIVDRRDHATAMASLILRGDLGEDGVPLGDTRIASIPVLVDTDSGAYTPNNRLFVDLVHTTLTQLLYGDEPLAPHVFVVNFSIGIADMRFAGHMSALARLMDWWAVKDGVLFVISAGNIGDHLDLPGERAITFEGLDFEVQCQRVRGALRSSAFDRTLLAPAEALNGVAVGAISRDLTDHKPIEQVGIISLESDDDTKPQMTSALGLGLHGSIKPDFLHVGGRQEVRVYPNGDDSRLSPVLASQRTGLVAASPRGGEHGTQKSRGTSPAAALTTRAILQAAEALSGEDGPYEGLELPRKTLSLLCRALAENAARWPDDAKDMYQEELDILGKRHHAKAKEQVCKYFGYGALNPELMRQSPDYGVTMVGTGSIQKDQARIFRMPLPESMSGDRVPRSMRVTVAWFSPINPARAQYRLSSLEAVSASGLENEEDSKWGLKLKGDGPDANMIKRGTIWSKRMIHETQRAPVFDEDDEIPICVQCRDAANGGLNEDDEIEFAIAVTLEIEADVQYDIHNEIEQKVRLTLHGEV
ncbi:MAG: S8 family serine peptidase [Candidatus Thiodiazotropha endolucinida]|nr:S8 family serine peptidase [Candidatus Thiodiazotropha endolucinida]